LGARSVKVVIDANNANIAYVAVASGGNGGVDQTCNIGPAGPGVYKTTDGGLHWRTHARSRQHELFDQSDQPGHLTTVGAGAPIDSVTDLIIDPFDSNRLILGPWVDRVGPGGRRDRRLGQREPGFKLAPHRRRR